MESKPLISIIVPCYGYAHYLPECIASIREQTYKNIEIIVVNDGSPDNTEEVCKQLNVSCVTKKNGGLASARNYGIARATGEYIMCLDADDILPKWSIENHMEIAGKDVIAQCGLQKFGSVNERHNPLGANFDSLYKQNTVYCNAVFPKEAWEKVGGYDESEIMRLGYEDWYVWLRMAHYGYKFVTSNKLGLNYRVHDNSMTRTTTLKNHDMLVKYIREHYKDEYDYTK